MSFQTIDGVKVWGTPDMGAVEQMKRCAAPDPFKD